MRAFVLEKFGAASQAFHLRDIPMPNLNAGDIRIKVTAFGLNFADIMARQGLYRELPPLPCVMGYDVEGVVDEIGTEVTGFMKGDRVFALTRFGGYAEYAVTESKAVGHLPLEAPVGMGCALATQCVTAYHAALHVQTLMPGEKVLIHAAAGGLGTALIQIARWKGCETIGVVGGAHKVKHLKSLGVDHIIDHHKGDYVDYVKAHLGGKVDVIFDNIGGKSIKKGKSILAPGGRIVSLGVASLTGRKGLLNLIRVVLGFGLFSPISFLGKSQSLIGVNMLKIGDHRKDVLEAGFRGVEKLYEEGVLQPHVDKVFQADELAQAHDYVEGRHSIGKVVVQFSPLAP